MLRRIACLTLVFAFVFCWSSVSVYAASDNVNLPTINVSSIIDQSGLNTTDFSVISIEPVYGNSSIQIGNAVCIRRDCDGGAEVHMLMAFNKCFEQECGLTRSAVTPPAVPWDPWSFSLLADFYYQYVVDTETSGNYYRPSKVGVKITGGDASVISSINYLSTAYWIMGDKYDYNTISNASPTVVATNTHMSVTCVYASPVLNGKKQGGTLSTTYAMGGSTSGKLRAGIKMMNGTTYGPYDQSVSF